MAECDKVAAHVWEATARAEGWWQHWKGNEIADELAKDARPYVLREPDQWIRARRNKQTKWEEFAATIEPAALKKHDAAERSPMVGGRGVKATVYLAGRSVCATCGAANRSQKGSGQGGPSALASSRRWASSAADTTYRSASRDPAARRRGRRSFPLSA